MNQPNLSTKFRIPTLGLIVIAGLLIALIAIYSFKVAIGLVFNYGMMAVMLQSHFGIHGNHQKNDGFYNSSNEFSKVPVKNDDLQNHKHGCH